MAKFIVFEGIDGSGKTTLSKNLAESLKNKGYRVLWTKEPFNDIKDLVASTDNIKDKALLFAIDRRQHIVELKKIWNEYDFILCDRYIDSTLVYQYILSNKKLSINYLKRINNASKLLKPDLIVYVNTDIDVVIKRLNTRQNDNLDKILNRETLIKLHNAYRKLYKKRKNVMYWLS